MAVAKKPAAKTAVNDAVAPPVNAAASSDGEHWEIQPSTLEFPAGDGPHLEQVYQGIPEAA